jgi:Autographiviridae endonuclease VII
MKHRHGITPEQFDEMLIAQDGKCALCSTEHGAMGRAGRLHIDHDHVTGKVRGLLCMFCNHAIERLDNHNGWADRAQAYLRKSK